MIRRIVVEGVFYRVIYTHPDLAMCKDSRWIEAWCDGMVPFPLNNQIYGYSSLEDVALNIDRIRLEYLGSKFTFKVVEIKHTIEDREVPESEYMCLGLRRPISKE